MLKKIKLEDGKFLVKSDTGKVDIGQGEVDAIICEKDEIEFITEVPEKK